MDLLLKVHENFGERARTLVGTTSLVSPRQFYGIDKNPFGVELTKVTLTLAKELALVETQNVLATEHVYLPLDFDTPLPLDNLDANIRCDDALFCEWPKVDAIVGNPPYQAKNKMQKEYGATYVASVRDRYPGVPGRADYCTYWFRRAHDELEAGERAGLVGTNTIRQNYSREGSLDHIVGNGGTITEAVSTQVWSGEAAVHVSIVNWVKGEEPRKKRLYRQLGDSRDSDVEAIELDSIGPALSGRLDVTGAKRLRANIDSDACYQGQTHGHKGFLLTHREAQKMVEQSADNSEVLFPYIIANDLLGKKPPVPSRFVIDLHPRDLFEASRYAVPFLRAKERVLPTRQEAAKKEEARNRKTLTENPKARINRHHRNFLNRWWTLSYPREELIGKIVRKPRYIVCGRVTKRPIFEFVNSKVRPNDALQVFPLPDDYSFGILQSDTHWLWFVERCSTLKGDFRYTSDTVFDTFPWPQSPTLKQAEAVAEAAVALRRLRRQVMDSNGWNFRELYRTLELPGTNPLKIAHDALGFAVRDAYGMGPDEDALTFLLKLNGELAACEAAGRTVAGPGLPGAIESQQPFLTTDCIGVDDVPA